MRRVFVALSITVTLVVGGIAYRNFQSCETWRDDYLRIEVAEMFKNSPVIMTEKRIIDEIGGPPWACTTPTPNEEDIARFRPAFAD